MSDHDQASGLRRLFGARQSRWTLAVTGAGGTAVTLNLASTLSRLGQRVLVLDRTCGEAAIALGLRARYELAHVLDGDKTLPEVLLDGPGGMTILPAARGLARVDADLAIREVLSDSLAPDAAAFDVWLVNGLPIPTAAGDDGDLLLVASPNRAAITRAYALLKEIVRDGISGRFRFVVNRAPSESEALVAYHNIADAARRFLAAQLEYCGYIPHEAAPRSARAGGPVRLADAKSTMGHAFALLAASVVPAPASAAPRALAL